MTPLRIAVIGCGFWSRFQIPAWNEVEGGKCVAVCDVNAERSRAAAARFDIPESYDDPRTLLDSVQPDAVEPPQLSVSVERNRSRRNDRKGQPSNLEARIRFLRIGTRSANNRVERTSLTIRKTSNHKL